MDILLNIIAIAAIILSGTAAILTPFLIGRSKPPYRWQDVSANTIEFIIVMLLALRVLGKI